MFFVKSNFPVFLFMDHLRTDSWFLLNYVKNQVKIFFILRLFRSYFISMKIFFKKNETFFRCVKHCLPVVNIEIDLIGKKNISISL